MPKGEEPMSTATSAAVPITHPEPHQVGEVSPAPFIDAVLGFQKTASIRAAIELDLFTAIAAGASGRETSASRTGAAERGVRILCDYLTVVGFLTKSGQTYSLTPSSQ